MTAQKRSERLLDVPSSIAAVSDGAIRASGAERLSDLEDRVPNLQIESQNSFAAAVRVRGVGDYSRNIGYDTRVGVYLDGVYLGQSPSLDQELVELERVEVLRGPQGALFGKNTVAGAINLISKTPADEFEGYVSAIVGNYNARRFTGRLNVPLSSATAVRLSASKLDRDGFAENLFRPNDEIDDRDSFSYRDQLRANLTDAFTLLASIDGLRKREIGDFGDPLTDSFGVFPDTVAPERYEESKNQSVPERVDVTGGSLEATYEFSNAFSMKSVSSYRDTDFETLFDTDHLPLDIHYVNYNDQYRQFTEELQLISPQGERFEYLLGLYYYRQRGTTDRAAVAGTLGSILGLAPGSQVLIDGEVVTRNVALFGNATYDLTDRVELGMGFRLSRETKDVDWAIDGSGAPPFGFATGAMVDSRTDNDVSPTATLTYRLAADVNIYARYAQGYKSGGFNIDFVSQDVFPGNVEFDKETARNYELGIKGSLFDQRATFSLTGFVTDYDDFQVNQLRDLGGGRSAFVIGNAASARTKGVEFEAFARVTPSLSFDGSFGVLDAEFERFPGGGGAGQDVSGNRLPFSSEFQAAFGADYERVVSATLRVFAHADYSYRGNFFTTVENQRSQPLLAGGSVPYAYVPGYDTVNARLALANIDDRWQIAVWSRNVLDSDHLVNTRREFFGAILEYRAEPRTYGIDLSARF